MHGFGWYMGGMWFWWVFLIVAGHGRGAHHLTSALTPGPSPAVAGEGRTT